MKTKAKQLHIEKGRWPSSPERRAAGKARFDQLVAEEQRIRAELKATPDTVGPLVEMAQFVVDVDGDPTAVDRLKEALERHKAKDALKARLAVLSKERNEANGDALYYRWKAGEVENVGGLGMFLVLGTGDTKAEAIAKAKSR